MYTASKSKKVATKNLKADKPSKFELFKFKMRVNRRIKLAAKSRVFNVKVAIPEGIRLREEVGQNSISQMSSYYRKKGYAINAVVGNSTTGLATFLEISWSK